MLGLDMDIEAELGIDSIKRVEILSTLEEKMPDLPTVSPEIMGSLKTLGQIIEYLAETGDNQEGTDNAGNGEAAECWDWTWTSRLNWASIPSNGWRFYPPSKKKCLICPRCLLKLWAV
jgi:hypothetical protein